MEEWRKSDVKLIEDSGTLRFDKVDGKAPWGLTIMYKRIGERVPRVDRM